MVRARHRLRTQRALTNPLWWLTGFAVVVCVGVIIAGVEFAGPPAAPPQITPAATTVLPRPDPTTTEASRAYLWALVTDGVAIEPHQAVGYGGEVCYMREHFNTSPFTLQYQLRQRAPGLRPLDVATLVDDAIKKLCPAGK